MKKILVFLAAGFEEMEAVIPVDVWKRAGFNTVTVSVTDSKIVAGAHNISIVADFLFEEISFDDADLIFLPGGMPGATNLDKHAGLRKVILDFHNKGKYITAICAAPLVLGHNNLLKGKKATCFPGYEKELLGAINTGNPIQVDGKIITAKGPGVAMDFALEIVSLFKSKTDAEKLAANMQIS